MESKKLIIFFAASLLLATLTNARDITDVWIVEQSNRTSSNVPVTFGQVFGPGDVQAGASVHAVSSSGLEMPTQVDIKATHADGSVRHAIITVFLSKLNAGETKRLRLVTSAVSSTSPIDLAAVLSSEYDAQINLNLAGVPYHASAKTLLSNIQNQDHWLAGELATEWHVSTPLLDSNNQPHPHLAARFYVRAFNGVQRIRTSVIVENNWTFVPEPSGFEYDVSVTVGENTVYAKQALAHTHHTRWRKTFWWGEPVDYIVKYNADYLLSTKAVPNYDRSINVSSSVLSELATNFEPMSNANITGYMPTTGAHQDIGPLPRWAAVYLLTMDPIAYKSTLVNGDAAASFQIHYRNENTDLPVTLADYPYMTWLGDRDATFNPNTGAYEAFPIVSNGLDTYTPDDAHQPSMAFLPYLITGDYYYLEELHFWSVWNALIPNPEYRGFEKGLLHWGEVRAQAWSLRTLGHAAYITPDAHPLKSYFESSLEHNIQDYTERTLGDPEANELGYLAEGAYIVASPYRLAQWEDDFFTWTTGYLVDLGYTSAFPLLDWKSKFILGRMASDDFCWLYAPGYTIQVADGSGTPFSSFAELYQNNYAGQPCQGLVMQGYPSEPTGYGANMQPGLAMVVDYDLAGSALAWNRYVSRDPKQNYSESPQFAIVPRDDPGDAFLFPPTITPFGGTFEEQVNITLTSRDNAEIYYTLDNSLPTEESLFYDGPITLRQSSTIKAVAFKADLPLSDVSEAYFNIQPDVEPPSIVSVSAQSRIAAVSILFSKAVEKSSAENSANYTIIPDVQIFSAVLDGDRRVILSTSALEKGIEYQLIVNNVQDLAQNPNTIAPNTAVAFRASHRVDDNMIALYTFQESVGSIVKDVSGIAPALDLEISDKNSIVWGAGFLSITAPTILLAMAGTKINNRCKVTNEITLEAWIRPSSLTQNGPARILTSSADPYDRNFTLGQENDAYQVRLRTTTTDLNGVDKALLGNSSVTDQLSHVVYTRSTDGDARLYVDSQLVGQRSDVDGTFNNWSAFQFALANEMDNSRPWLGEFHLVALHDRALTNEQVEQNFDAGPYIQDSSTQIYDNDQKPITDFELHRNFPNPFNSSTNIRFSLPQSAVVTLTIYSIQGQKVQELVSDSFPAGHHSINWTATDVASGVYMYRVKAQAADGTVFNSFHKMLLMK